MRGYLLVLAACNSPGTATKTEAEVQLERIARGAKAYWIDKAVPPVGKAAAMPAVDCCAQPGHRCPAQTAAQWEAASPVWRDLHFHVEGSTSFRYSYDSSDGFAYVATATGDPDCTGAAVTYRLVGTIVNAELVSTISR
ncbi:MAG: hypothetical protein ABI867_22570 [Kofleriaceae bacterium]